MDVTRDRFNTSTVKPGFINYTYEKTYRRDMRRMHAVQRLITKGEMEKRRNDKSKAFVYSTKT